MGGKGSRSGSVVRGFGVVAIHAAGVLVGERCERSVVSDQYDRLGLPRRFVAAHARRVRWHPRHGNANGVGSLFKQGNERTDWDVTLYDVAIDESRVTRDRIQGNAGLCLERREVTVLLDLDLRSVVL
jgi:hypothetical protein